MSYVWGAGGPGFEYPTCYRTENRFLTLRAALLVFWALVLFWLVTAEPDQPTGAALLNPNVERGSGVPHVLLGTVLLIWAGIDVFVVWCQRRVLLAAGQPAGLSPDLPFHATGAAVGAANVLQAVNAGRIPGAEVAGPYRSWLTRWTPDALHAPSTLLVYLSRRLASLLFTAPLLVALALLWLLAPGPSLPPVALVLSGAAMAQVAYAAWISESTPGPLVVVLGAIGVLAAALATLLLGERLPQLAWMQGLALSQAALALLGGLLLMEALAFVAVRSHARAPQSEPLGQADAEGHFDVDSERLLKEIDKELMRRWTEGVPSRRYVRKLPQDHKEDGSPGLAQYLEESQPVLPSGRGDPTPVMPLASRAGLLMLLGLGLTMIVAAGMTWVRMTHALMQDAAAPWSPAALALALAAVGAYAMRVGHFAWSRTEVVSQLVHAQLAAAQADGSGALTLRVRVLQATSAFYTAGRHLPGSRRLLRLVPDMSAAQRFIQQLHYFCARGAVSEASPARGDAGARRPVPSAMPASPVRVAGPSAGVPRFCPICGTPCLQGARFCQNCGNELVVPPR